MKGKSISGFAELDDFGLVAQRARECEYKISVKSLKVCF